MGFQVKVQDPETGKTALVSPQNASDVIQHLGWKRVGQVEVKDDFVGNATDLLERMEGGKRANAANASLDPQNPPEVIETTIEDSDADLSDFSSDDSNDADADDNGDEVDNAAE